MRLYGIRIKKVMLNNNPQGKINEEEPILFHILKMLKCREARTIHQLQEPNSNTITTPKDIICTSVTNLKNNYGTIPVDNNCVVTMIEAIKPKCPTTQADCLKGPITSMKS
jgi:hypothetical protein